MAQERATRLMGEHGDVTVVWDESEDEKMEAIIQKKMDGVWPVLKTVMRDKRGSTHD